MKLVKCPECDELVKIEDVVFTLYDFNEEEKFESEIKQRDKVAVCKKHVEQCSKCKEFWTDEYIRECKECGILLCNFHNSYCNLCYDSICEKCFYKIHLKKDTICKDCGNRYSFFFEKCADSWYLSWCFNCDSEEVFNDYLKQDKYISKHLTNYCPIPLEKFTSLFTK